MVTYTVHERDSSGKDVAARADGILFVKEGFAWWALLFPVLWLLYHRMWIVLLGFVVIAGVLQAGVSVADMPEAIAGFASMGLGFLLALEGNDLRRWSLTRKGYRFAGLVSGRDLGECERRFLTGWLARQATQGGESPNAPPQTRKANVAAAPRDAKASQSDDVIGLFPEPSG